MQDGEILRALEDKWETIRSRVLGVATGFRRGLYVWGSAGTSKSYTVEEAVKRTGRGYVLTNTHITALGLFELFEENPNHIHILDDVETILADRKTVGVLKAALWGKNIVWQNGTAGRREFEFTGGVVIVANSSPDMYPALVSRLDPLHYQPTREEIGAFMRKLASEGFRHGDRYLKPVACQEVAAGVIDLSQSRERPLDLCAYVGACLDRMQYEFNLSSVHWTDLLESSIQAKVLTPAVKPKGVDYAAVAKAIAELPRAERLKEWRQQTGRGQSSMYRWLGRPDPEAN